MGVELSDGRLLYALVINATGHWVDQLMQRSESRAAPMLHTTRGNIGSLAAPGTRRRGSTSRRSGGRPSS